MPLLRRAIDRFRQARARYVDYLRASTLELPRLGALFIPLIAIAVVLVALVAFGVTGSSSAMLWPYFSNAEDTATLAGMAQSIRSDEWFVQTPWTISQVQQGLPVVNTVLPGGMDATIQHDLPSWDWSTIFRPNLIGFWFLPLDNAMALKWWLPAGALIAAAYVLFLTLMRDRPITSLTLAIAFYLSPFFQWWHISPTLFAPAWAMLVMAAALWLQRTQSQASKYVFAITVAYLTITVGMLVYVPFIVPCALIAALFVAGVLFVPPASHRSWAGRLARFVPIAISGAIGLAVLLVWLATRWTSVDRFLSTKYPGQRLQEVGEGSMADLASILGAPFSNGMSAVGGGELGKNASEASTFLLVGLFLAVPLIYQFLISLRTGWRRADWLVASMLVAIILICAYYAVPGWDMLAHGLGLDRTTTARIRIGIGLISFLMIPIFVSRMIGVVEKRERLPTLVIAVSAFVPIICYLWLLRLLIKSGSSILDYTMWLVVLTLFFVSVLALLKGHVSAGIASLVAASLVVGATVNPVRIGVFDLNETSVAAELRQIQSRDPGTWIAMGDPAIALVVESGVPAFSGYQSSPTPEMWSAIDPDGRFEDSWNRLGLVAWSPQQGPIEVTSPGVDVVMVTFDSCGEFAQGNIKHVLAMGELDQPCLELVSTQRPGTADFYFYDVTPVRQEPGAPEAGLD